MSKLTEEQKQAILSIKKGADIFGYALAGTLRGIEKTYPDLITIGEAMGLYQPADRLPYFGAIATKEGIRQATKKD
jgi:hypothetical protein